ncbi:solute carrier family 25 (mitochondrial iron transporter), member 28/37 [Strigomonas culicis]|nr:solute carrier family 25 (mitochondrial iron transporter), member 28/37 [Strigomonas culicis]|eukprot:EPY28500.1 solute carrier family 25 (mitochondrial iron transporter), member 28/37 [Strigomonas culicis]
MFPFDTIKTRVQSGSACHTRQALKHIFHDGGCTSLYRGCVPILVSAVPAHGAYFGFYEATKRIAGDTPVGIALAACAATIAHDTVSTPFDVVKQRMQMDSRKMFSNSLRCVLSVVRKEGLQSLFVSLPTTFCMNIPHYATYWLVYELLLRQMHDGSSRDYGNELSTEFLVAGFCAGGAASVVSFPLDNVKTIIQLGHSQSFASAWRYVLMRRGIYGMFSGVVPRIMYTAPSGAIMMFSYETAKSKLLSF